MQMEIFASLEFDLFRVQLKFAFRIWPLLHEIKTLFLRTKLKQTLIKQNYSTIDYFTLT